MSKTKEQIEEDMERGDLEEDLYTDEGREVAREEGEITNVEEGFMQGYEGEAKSAKCSNCKKVLKGDFIEEEFHSEVLKFCSDKCAREYEKEHKA